MVEEEEEEEEEEEDGEDMVEQHFLDRFIFWRRKEKVKVKVQTEYFFKSYFAHLVGSMMKEELLHFEEIENVANLGPLGLFSLSVIFLYL